MRTIAFILLTALTALWLYFGVASEYRLSGPLVRVEGPAMDGDAPTSAGLNNEGVRLAGEGRAEDALVYLERARDFSPEHPVIRANVDKQETRVWKDAFEQVLVAGTVIMGVLFGGGTIFTAFRALAEKRRLKRLHLCAEPALTIRPGQTHANFTLPFNRPLCRGLLRRNPLTIVWSCSGQGKHMKSRPPVKVSGQRLEVKLDRDRVERLRRYPGNWRGFLYLGNTPVGEAVARVI
ncbi:MAG: hypothetical protein V3T86_15220 [Planctomycetota bacterium]